MIYFYLQLLNAHENSETLQTHHLKTGLNIKQRSGVIMLCTFHNHTETTPGLPHGVSHVHFYMIHSTGILHHHGTFCFFFITYRRWGQSTSYNVAHPACGHKGSTHLSPVQAYEFLSRCRFSTPTPRQPMIEVFVLASSRFPLRKSEEKITPADTRTHKFRLSGRTLYPLVHGGSPEC